MLGACLLTVIPQLVFADGPSPFENTPRENSIRTVPALQDNGSGVPPQNITPPVNPVMDAWRNPSPLSAEDSSAPLVDPSRPIARELSDQEVSVLVDNVFLNMVNEGHKDNLSSILDYISREDYEGLVKLQNENPAILDSLRDSLQAIRMGYSENSGAKNFVDDWLSRINYMNANLSRSKASAGGPSHPLVETAVRLYKPIADRVAEIAKGLEAANRTSDGSGGLLKNYSAKAREFVLNSFNRAQANLANGMLSSPLEATAFAAEINPARTSSAALNQTAAREMTIAELYVKGRNYQVVDSVYIGKDFIYAQKMLHPPANLHPYLKWLLYTRNLTPRMVENYLATREAVGAIYAQAKEGRGNIRYRGKVYGAFLPFAETAAGNYELVKTASAE